MKYCINCGKKISKNVKFCPYCGASQKHATKAPKTKDSTSHQSTKSKAIDKANHMADKIKIFTSGIPSLLFCDAIILIVIWPFSLSELNLGGGPLFAILSFIISVIMAAGTYAGIKAISTQHDKLKNSKEQKIITYGILYINITSKISYVLATIIALIIKIIFVIIYFVILILISLL